MDDAGPFMAVLFGIGFLLLIGGVMGKGCADDTWRVRLVDEADYVAAVRSEVLAERAVLKAKRGK